MKKNFISLSLTAPHSFQPNLLNFNGMSMQKKKLKKLRHFLVKLNATTPTDFFFTHNTRYHKLVKPIILYIFNRRNRVYNTRYNIKKQGDIVDIFFLFVLSNKEEEREPIWCRGSRENEERRSSSSKMMIVM